MVAWLERPAERQKDLSDIVFIWDNALPDDDNRRWGPDHPVGAAALAYEDQSSFFCGWQLGTIGQPQHLHWVRRSVELMRDAESVRFAQLVSASRYVGDDIEIRLQARLTAFERGHRRHAGACVNAAHRANTTSADRADAASSEDAISLGRGQISADAPSRRNRSPSRHPL